MIKVATEGRIVAVQPRIRLLRSFDQRQHNYPGYALLVASDKPPVWIGVGPAAHAKFVFCAGGSFSAEVEPVANQELEAVDYYKATKIRYTPGGSQRESPPPWPGVPPDGGRNDHRPMEPQGEALPEGNVLLWPEILPELSAWPGARSPQQKRDELDGGRLGGRRRDFTSRPRRLKRRSADA